MSIFYNLKQRIVDWLAQNFERDEGIDLLKDKQALQRLTETAEKAKMELSSLTQTSIRYVTISMPSFYEWISLFGMITEEKLSVFTVYLSLPPLRMAQNTLTPP